MKNKCTSTVRSEQARTAAALSEAAERTINKKKKKKTKKKKKKKHWLPSFKVSLDEVARPQTNSFCKALKT